MWWVVLIVVVAAFVFFEWRSRNKPLVPGLGDHRGTHSAAHSAAHNGGRPVTGGRKADGRS